VRSNAGGIAATAVALFLGILVVTQFRSQDVYSRSLQLETPASLTTLIANLSDRNNSLRDEIFDLRLRRRGGARFGRERPRVAHGEPAGDRPAEDLRSGERRARSGDLGEDRRDLRRSRDERPDE